MLAKIHNSRPSPWNPNSLSGMDPKTQKYLKKLNILKTLFWDILEEKKKWMNLIKDQIWRGTLVAERGVQWY